MEWTLNGDRPVYIQIIEQVKHRIVSEQYPAGSRLPSVRDLALEASVNPNTMQRALTDLEREGLIFAERTNGRFVTVDVEVLKKLRQDLLFQIAQEFLGKMEKIGVTPKEVIAIIEKSVKE